MGYKLVDSHCHLDNDKFTDSLDDIVRKSIDGDVIALINTGYDISSSKKSVEMACKYKEIFATVGIHPHDAKQAPNDYLNILEKLLAQKKVVALGEIGLDYHYDFSPRDVQRKIFKEQLDLSFQLRKPFVIHQRESMGDMLTILNEFPNPLHGAMFHCYSGSTEVALQLIKKGYILSFGGPVTFKNAKKTVEVVRQVPLDYMLLETDCPYLTPEPFRGKINHPYYVKYVAEKISQIKGIDIEKVAMVTSDNANQFFGLGLKL